MNAMPDTHVATDHLRLFGAPQLTVVGSGARHALPWARPAALLAYLAGQPGWHSQERLMALFHAGASPAAASQRLQRLQLQVASLDPALSAIEASDGRLRWAGSSDVAQFEAAAARGQWDEALAHAPEHFLQGVGPLGIDELDLYFAGQRLRLGERLCAALASAIRSDEPSPRRTTWMERLARQEWLDEYAVQLLDEHARTPRERAVVIEARAALGRGMPPAFGHAQWRARPAAAAEGRRTDAPRAPLLDAGAASPAELGGQALANLLGNDPVALALAAPVLEHVPALALLAELAPMALDTPGAALPMGLLRIAHASWARLDAHEREVVRCAGRLGRVAIGQLIAASGSDMPGCVRLHRKRWLVVQEGFAVLPPWAAAFAASQSAAQPP